MRKEERKREYITLSWSVCLPKQFSKKLGSYNAASYRQTAYTSQLLVSKSTWSRNSSSKVLPTSQLQTQISTASILYTIRQLKIRRKKRKGRDPWQGLVMQRLAAQLMWIFPNCLSHHDLVLTFSVPAWDCRGRRIVKELDLKLTLGMVQRR